MIALLRLNLLLWRRRVAGQLTISGSLMLPWLGLFILVLGQVSGAKLAESARGLAFMSVVGFGAPALANLVARSLHDGQGRRQAMLLRTSGLGGTAIVGSHLGAGAVMAMFIVGAAHVLPLVVGPDRVCVRNAAAGALALMFVPPVAIPVAFVLPRMASIVLLTIVATPGVGSVLAGALDESALTDVRVQAWDGHFRLIPLALAALAANATCFLLVSPAWSRWASRRGF